MFSSATWVELYVSNVLIAIWVTEFAQSHCLDALITCILQEWNQPVSAQSHCSGTQWWEVEMPVSLQWLFLILLVSQQKRITLGSMLRFPFLFYFFLFYHMTAMWANGFWWKWDIVRTFLRKFSLPLSFEITSKLKEFPVEGLEKWFNGELRLPVQRTLIQFSEPYSGSQPSLTQVPRDLPSSCVFLQVLLHTSYVCIDSGKILIHKHKNK